MTAAVVASLLVSRKARQDNQRLQKENTRLRSDIGELTVDEGAEDKFHVIAVPTSDFMTWKWRMYVPQGSHLGLSIVTNGIKRDIIPDTGTVFRTLTTGEHSFTAALRKNEQQDQWEWVFTTDGNQQFYGPLQEDVEWVKHTRPCICDQAGEYGKQVATKFSEALALLVYMPTRRSAQEDRKITEGKGALIWVHPIR
jgi:hypothetical protein